MGNFIKNILNVLRLPEEDLDDDYDDYVSEMEEKERKREERVTKKSRQSDYKEPAEIKPPVRSSVQSAPKTSALRDDYDNAFSQTAAAQSTAYADNKKTQRLSGGKVVPIRTTAKGMEVCIMKPTSFEDSQDICDILLSGRAAVINLEGFNVELAQRVMDFVSGSVYAMNGRLHQISNYIFIISPDTVDISGDYLDIIRQDGFGVPTLNKGF